MTTTHLVARSVRYYWRTNLAAALGVGVAVSALAGALIVGESVRGSLHDLAVSRLGSTESIISAGFLFTDQLGERLASDPAFRSRWTGAVPVFMLEGIVTHERSGTRAGGIQVFGVDDRFWRFHEVADVAGPAGREAFVSSALARELAAVEGDALLLRVQKPSVVPASVIQGRRDEPGRAIRVSLARVLARDRLGDFSPRPQQGASRAIFVPLDRLQRDLDLSHRVNMLLVGSSVPVSSTVAQRFSAADALVALVEQQADLADLGIRMRPLRSVTLSVESDTGLLVDRFAEGAVQAARKIGAEPMPVFTYLATAIKANGRETPYSLVSALPEESIINSAALKRCATVSGTDPRHGGATSRGGAASGGGAALQRRDGAALQRCVWLTQWTADDLGARIGDPVTLEYYLWSDEAGLTTASADFEVAGVLPMSGLAIDADLTPEYPGVSTSANITDWDPPFPVDLKRIRPKDEDYWDDYLTAPKAFIRIEDGQALWQSRYGKVSSVRVPAGSRAMTALHAAYREVFPAYLPVNAAEFRVIPVRNQALAAASGTTDFGEYFTYFSFFLVVSSLLLTVLFFRLGIEQRAAQIGLFAAMGYTPPVIRRLLLAEGAVLAIAGAGIGVGGALAYSALIMLALRTWWIDAVGTTDLVLHVSSAPLVAGAGAGIVAGLACIAWSVRVLHHASARQLMSGAWVDTGRLPAEAGSYRSGGGSHRSTTKDTKATKRLFRAVGEFRAFREFRGLAVSGGTLALVLVLAGFAGWIPATAAFFGSGTLLLLSGLCALASWLRGTARRTFIESGWPVARLGLRNVRYRPSRSVLSVALIAAATFLIVSVGAFRRGAEQAGDRSSSSGGYALIAETVAPLMHDPSTPAGREALNLDVPAEVDVARFRLRPGDDASCLNLYRPQSPRLLGATEAFARQNRFSFAKSIDGADAEEANPWLLLNRRFDDDAVPVIGDATSLAYAFHLAVGDDYVMQGPDGRPLRLRIVGALRDSVLQSELIMSEAQFTRLFPRQEGFRLFLIATAPDHARAVGAALEDQLQDFGMDVQSTADRLASYHRVENTFLTTFQALGALGLVLGTLGLGTVLLRNVLERRRELAVLQATGYRRSHLVLMVMAESVFLLASGLALGTVCAAIAIAPAYAARAQAFPLLSTLGLLVAVMIAGLLSTLMATRVVARSPLLEALKNE